MLDVFFSVGKLSFGIRASKHVVGVTVLVYQIPMAKYEGAAKASGSQAGEA